MIRRALLGGLIAMPAAAQGQNRPPPPMRPLAEARSQLVAFDAPVFPYRGRVPDTGKPFLDVREGARRGHRTGRGDVLWEDPTYSDRRSLLFLPKGFDAARPALIVFYLHGNGATLERDVRDRQAVPRQLEESGLNAALVAPQLAVDAADSSAGNLWRPGYFARMIDEAAERLMRLHGDRRAGPALNAAPVVLVAYSGGYLPAAFALADGGAGHRVRGTILMDALYGEEAKFAAWFGARRRQVFLLSAFTDSTRDYQATLRELLAARGIAPTSAMPAALSPGTASFIAAGGIERHADFATQAWTANPLRAAFAAIPGYKVR